MATKKEKAIEAAAEPVREKIRQDRESVDYPLRAILDYVHEHLLAEKLTLEKILEKCGISDRGILIAFHRTLRNAPAAYISECRLEIAARLLESTVSFSIKEIAELLGYSSGSAFGRAFATWSGQTPTAYRRNSLSLKSRHIRLPGAHFLRAEFLSAWKAGNVDDRVAGELAEFMAELRGVSSGTAFAENPHVLMLERKLAADMWEILKENHSLLFEYTQRSSMLFQTPALFELLLEKSRQEGRGDRNQGVVLAELALKSLTGLAATLSEDDFYQMKARAWGQLGSARKLTGDYLKADDAFANAQKFLKLASTASPMVEAELMFLESCLRLDQGQLSRASSLAKEAKKVVARFPLQEQVLKARIELVLGSVAFQERNWDLALAKFLAVERALKPGDDPFLRLAALHNLAALMLKTDRYGEAADFAYKARSIAADQSWAETEGQMLWLWALIKVKAGSPLEGRLGLRKACDIFKAKQKHRRFALTLLDLATVELTEDPASKEGSALAVEGSKLLANFGLAAESLSLLMALQETLEDKGQVLALLFRLSHQLRQDWADIGCPEVDLGSAPPDPS